MKKLTIAVLASFITLSASAQTVTLTTPEALPARTALTTGDITEHRADLSKNPNDVPSAAITVRKLDGSGNTQAEFRCDVVGNAEMNLYLTQMETAVAGEPSGTTLAARAQRRNGRALKFLQTNAATLTTPCTQFGAGTLNP